MSGMMLYDQNAELATSTVGERVVLEGDELVGVERSPLSGTTSSINSSVLVNPQVFTVSFRSDSDGGSGN